MSILPEYDICPVATSKPSIVSPLLRNKRIIARLSQLRSHQDLPISLQAQNLPITLQEFPIPKLKSSQAKSLDIFRFAEFLPDNGLTIRHGQPSKGNPILHRSEYALEYDTRLRNSLWVCEHLFQNNVINKGHISRGSSVFKCVLDLSH
jgi:hypothetical protein